jgi:hypothetical protein
MSEKINDKNAIALEKITNIISNVIETKMSKLDVLSSKVEEMDGAIANVNGFINEIYKLQSIIDANKVIIDEQNNSKSNNYTVRNRRISKL